MKRRSDASIEADRVGPFVACLAGTLLAWILWASLYPMDFVSGASEYAARIRDGLVAFSVPNLWGHVLLMGTFGCLLALLPRLGVWSLAGLCLLIELLQGAVVGRHPRISDLAINLLVSGLGWWLIVRVVGREKARTVVEAQIDGLSRGVAVLAFVLLGLAVGSSGRSTSLNDWSSEFPLLLADEATRDRPWIGELQAVAFYSSALDASTVRALSELPAADSAGAERRRGLGAVAIYASDTREAETIEDISKVPPLLPLRAVDHGGDRSFSTDVPTTKLADAAGSGSAFSVEIRGRTPSNAQTGPARIVSYSKDAYQRNFTVGQLGAAIEFRVRSPATGPNGTEDAPLWPEVFSDDAFHHLLLTYESGRMHLYKDGTDLGRREIGVGWAGLGRNHLLASLVLLAIPSGLFLRIGWHQWEHRTRRILGAALGLGVAFAGALIAAIVYKSGVDWLTPGLALLGVPAADLALSLELSRNERRRRSCTHMDSSHR